MEKETKEVWYDNPRTVTNVIIGIIFVIVLLSQSFAISNNLTVAEILGSILSHNIIYLVVVIYFILLMTKFGRKYFDYLNVFLIIVHLIIAVTSLLVVFQAFGLGSMLKFAIDFLIFIYLVHMLLIRSKLWGSLNLEKSPFNEISNSGYFQVIAILDVIFLAVELITTTSFAGTILALLDCFYILLFVRYIYLYGVFLEGVKIERKEKPKKNYGGKVRESLDEYVDMGKIDDVLENFGDKVANIFDGAKDKAVEVKNKVVENVDNGNFEKGVNKAYDKTMKVAGEFKDSLIEVTSDIVGTKKEDKDKEKDSKKTTSKKEKK